jgi:hypothetical protein
LEFNTLLLLINYWNTIIYLCVFCRYLATGDTFQTIAFSYHVGRSTVGEVVQKTCVAIWDALVLECMPVPDQNMWKSIEAQFKEKWNFPNCIGGLDGKHVVMQAPANSGSLYFNYKGSHSIVLMALVDAAYKFILIDVGAYGQDSDGGVFSNSTFGQAFLNNQLNIPPPKVLPYLPQTTSPTPHVIVADEAFPLKPNIMRPYGGRELTEAKRIFNYRLSRARRVSENAFGILSNRWRIFHRKIMGEPCNVECYVKACCILHNYLAILNPINTSDEYMEASPEVQSMFNLTPTTARNFADSAQSIRDNFCNYFVSNIGELPWQYSIVRRGL